MVKPFPVTDATIRWGSNVDIGYSGFIVQHHSFVSAGIRWFTRWDELPGVPDPSHAFVITGPDNTVEAFSTGVRQGTLSAYLNDPTCALLVRKPADWTALMGQRIAEEAFKRVGEKYAFLTDAALAVSGSIGGHLINVLTRGWFALTIARLAEQSRHDMCSEMTAKCLQAITSLSHRGCLQENADLITPARLFCDAFCYETGATELLP